MVEKTERFQTDSGDKPIIDSVADGLMKPESASDQPVVHDSTTSAGKPIEEQVRKQWDPKKRGGLPTFLPRR